MIGTASAGEDDNLIAAVDSDLSGKIIPFSQVPKAVFNSDPTLYTDLVISNKLSNICGKAINILQPSYSLIHQISAASHVNLPDVVFAPTSSFIKYEVAYISENPLTKAEIKTVLLKFQSPIISKDGNVWIVTILAPKGPLVNKLDLNNQNALNNYLTSSDFFPKSDSNLRALRLGDITGFNPINLNFVYSAEFKTNLTPLTDEDTIKSTFNKRFQKSLLVDHQLFDSVNKTIHSKTCGSSVIESFHVNSLPINDADLTQKFTVGHKLATNIHNQPQLKFNLIYYTLNNISKIIK